MLKIKAFLKSAGIFLLALGMASCSFINGGVGGNTETKDFTQDNITIDGTTVGNNFAYLTYSLSEFAGKEITVDFSADMKVTNKGSAPATLMWQLNTSDYPVIAQERFDAGESTKHVTGKNENPIKIAADTVLYLSTYGTTPEDLTIEISNVKYSISYVGKKTENKKEKKYPTDIFTVGDEKVCGITVGDKDNPITSPFESALAFDVGTARDVKYNADGSVTYIATAAGGAGGGAAFYLKSDKSGINISNYESVKFEFVCSPITGKWNPSAKNPGFALRLLPTDSSGLFGGFEDVQYFEMDKEYGTYSATIAIPDNFANKVIDSSDFDSIMAFGFKFNDYNRGNSDGDQLMIQIKNVVFNKKAGSPADKPFNDGLEAADRGTVKKIEYPTHDYAKNDTTGYNKPAWVYLPAGYNPEDKDTKYPLFILMHGYGQNQDTWGLTDKGNGGRIKGYMDRRMKSGEVKKFILVVPTGVASASYANGSGSDIDGFNAFGGELRNDLIPYMRENFNIADGRDNVAMAGLSMGGGQTFNIGIGECLDLISYFGAFSAATFTSAAEYKAGVEAKAEFKDLKIHQLYMICGTADDLVIGGFKDFVPVMESWDKIEKFESETYEGGTHDFPVWYRGFKHLIPLLFK